MREKINNDARFRTTLITRKTTCKSYMFGPFSDAAFYLMSIGKICISVYKLLIIYQLIMSASVRVIASADLPFFH